MNDSDKVGRIYMLKFSDTSFYIGSTIQTLNKRLQNHKAYYKTKNNLNLTSKLNKKISQLGYDNITIELIEEFKYTNKKDLLIKENDLIEKNISNKLCLNTILSYNKNKKVINKIGKIYMLKCSDGYYYIGSTSKTLNDRLSAHKYSSRNQKTKLYNHINKLGWENVSISLIEEINIRDNTDLLKKEIEHIKNNYSEKCLNSDNIYSKEQVKENKLLSNRKYYKNKKNIIKEKNKEYKINNKEFIKEINKNYRDNNIDKIKEYFENNKDKINIKKKEYLEKNKEKIKIRSKLYYINNREKLNEYKRIYRENNIEAQIMKSREYYNKNKDIMNEKRRLYLKRKKEEKITNMID